MFHGNIMDLLFFVKDIICLDFYGLHVYMLFERKKTPVLSTRRFSIAKNIFYSCPSILLSSDIAITPGYVREISLRCPNVFHLFTVFIVIAISKECDNRVIQNILIFCHILLILQS